VICRDSHDRKEKIASCYSSWAGRIVLRPSNVSYHFFAIPTYRFLARGWRGGAVARSIDRKLSGVVREQ